jgi:uncharacterized membrane protein HdeD (DUF308 family)
MTSPNPLMVRARNQLLIGVVLLVLGVALAAGLVLGEATVAAAIGYAIGIVGLILVINSAVTRRKGDG